MNILMLGWELPPHNSGGLGVACYHMAKQLSSQGVAIDFVVPYKADHKIDFMNVHSAVNVSVEQLLVPGAYDSACYACEDPEMCEHIVPTSLRQQQLIYTNYVESMLQTQNPDAIHAHDWLTFEAGMRAKTLTDKPLIAHVHATEFDRAGSSHGNPLVHEIELHGLLMADRVIAVSKATKNIIVKEYGIPADKIEVVHNSIDVSEYPALTGDNTYRYLCEMKARGHKVIVSVGRLTLQKGLCHLLEAAQRAVAVEPKLLFLIAGSGELRDELLEQAAARGIAKNVIFTGFVRGKAWRDAYDIGDIFIMPSVSEPFGLVALEAAGHDSAVMISKQSGVVEVLKNTLQFDFWDTQRMADQIVAVAQHPSLQDSLRRMVSEEYARLSWKKAAESFVQVYESVQKVEVHS